MQRISRSFLLHEKVSDKIKKYTIKSTLATHRADILDQRMYCSYELGHYGVHAVPDLKGASGYPCPGCRLFRGASKLIKELKIQAPMINF